MTPEKLAFFRSQTEELAAQANRVRSLIQDAHWYTDGAFKEALLLEALRRRMPFGMQARRGFVLNEDFSVCSAEQDCVVHERQSSTPIFEAVDFQIVRAAGVLALISVKTRFHKGEFVDALRGLASALRIVAEQPKAPTPFVGVFFFDEDPAVQEATVVGWVRELVEDGTLPVVQRNAIDGDRCISPIHFATLRNRIGRVEFAVDSAPRVLQHSVDGLASALFLFNFEKSVIIHRDVEGVAAWAELEDATVARLASSVTLE